MRKQWRLRRLEQPGYRERIAAADRARHQRLKAWVNKYKVEHGCVDCGYRADPVALDFDHTEGKTTDIAYLKSIGAIQREIARHKCVVRCANCHRVRTHERLHQTSSLDGAGAAASSVATS